MSLWQRISQRPWIFSVIIFSALCLWLFSAPNQAETETQQPSQLDVPLANVKVETFTSQPVTRTVALYGRTAPDRSATLGAEVSGRVESRLVRKGEAVKAGQPLVQLDKADREIQLRRAQALVEVRQKEYNAAKSLRSRGLQGEVALSQAEANLIEAKASLRNVTLALENTVIKAPFDGIVQTMHVQKGDFLGVGDPVALIVDLDPLVIYADVSERHIHRINEGQSASVRLIDGKTYDATLRYQSAVSSEQTNTFALELSLPNPEMQLAAGISAEVELNLESRTAMKLAPSMLALNELGDLGVKTITEKQIDNESQHYVSFTVIDVVKVEPDGVWLAGLGDQADIITVGQGFVREGDQVIVTRTK
ncbi:efflux RND transporter periplasmic adaptor subunit [Thaumasiovibrio subtropicus]|uniref:efflux RND transporter periplasmic adaptor subunit n=1 Tax=Thaumasiovibrio subtropicus TaxID=1891207 RepID=UPI000B361617|nr:efflux RND transporter periplasmic adaptor subunit [Thaumasiovibrio subtropicus]